MLGFRNECTSNSGHLDFSVSYTTAVQCIAPQHVLAIQTHLTLPRSLAVSSLASGWAAGTWRSTLWGRRQEDEALATSLGGRRQPGAVLQRCGLPSAWQGPLPAAVTSNPVGRSPWLWHVTNVPGDLGREEGTSWAAGEAFFRGRFSLRNTCVSSRGGRGEESPFLSSLHGRDG